MPSPGGQITTMVTSVFRRLSVLGNISLRSCFILIAVVPVFAASAATSGATTVVRADVKSGRLVRTIVMEATNTRTISNPELEKIVDRIAVEQGVESPLVHSVIRAESNYNP